MEGKPSQQWTPVKSMYHISFAVLTVASLAFIAFSIFDFLIPFLQQENAHGRWVQVVCLITKSESGHRGTNKIEYSYEFYGRKYTSDRYSFFDSEMSKQLANSVPSITNGYIDPQSPSQAVLNIDVPIWSSAIFIFITVLFIIFSWVRVIRKYQNAPE